MRRTVLLLIVIAFTARAEQKNVKLLTGLTDLELQRTMNMMRASLGTHCDHCHVIDKEWDFASDAKPAKQRARDMIKMVMDVNRTAFEGRAEISCFTCHRGAVRPVSLATLPQIPPPFPTPQRKDLQLPEARTLVEKYGKALGDATRLSSRTLKGDVTRGPMTVPIEVHAKGARVRQITHLPKGALTQTFDGTTYWWRDHEGIEVMPPRGQQEFRAVADAFAPVLPSEIGADARTTGKDKIGDRDVWVVSSGWKKFYFDAESGLLLRSVLVTPTAIGRYAQQTDYEDYRDAGGTRFPYRTRFSLVDPWSGSTREYKSVELGVPIDDAIFAKPQ
ncbi:MAG TPA: c-type cytochrome [Thermoanaerobaculia bacterium]|nr:c-type cytochrome [Thermoanaerobaculia bacterium]